MMDFIEFLNQADESELKKLEGTSDGQVSKIVANRPFATIDEVARLRGIGIKRMATWQEGYEQFAEGAPEKTNIVEQVEEPVAKTGGEQKPRRNIIGRLITWLVILLLLGGAVYAAIKWGIPFIYDKYIKPVETNAAEISDLASQQSVEVSRLTEEIILLQQRVKELEDRAAGFDAALEAHDNALAKLDALQQTLNENMAVQKADLLQEISDQITLTRAIELLSRARLYLSDSNFGLAKADLVTCRTLLFPMIEKLPTDFANALRVVVSRLDLAIANLPAYPVVAVYDVDTAWQYLVDGLPNVPEMAVTPLVLPSPETPSPIPTEVPASTEEPAVEATAAP